MLNSAQFQTAKVIGPILAGELLAIFAMYRSTHVAADQNGVKTAALWCFLIFAAGCLLMIVALAFVRLDPAHRRRKHEPIHSAMLQGARYIAGRRDIIVMFILIIVVGVTASPFATLLPALVKLPLTVLLH